MIWIVGIWKGVGRWRGEAAVLGRDGDRFAPIPVLSTVKEDPSSAGTLFRNEQQAIGVSLLLALAAWRLRRVLSG